MYAKAFKKSKYRWHYIFLIYDFEPVGASLSLLPKNGNRDRKRYKNRKCEKIYRKNRHLAMPIFVICLYKNTQKSYQSQSLNY